LIVKLQHQGHHIIWRVMTGYCRLKHLQFGVKTQKSISINELVEVISQNILKRKKR